MRVMRIALMGGLLWSAACANAQPAAEQPQASDDGQLVTQPVVPLQCEPSPRMPVEGRASPYDSTTVQVGGEQALRLLRAARGPRP
jgi:hypothetical protein